eukprot:4040470-Amphidinium_carterae.1
MQCPRGYTGSCIADRRFNPAYGGLAASSRYALFPRMPEGHSRRAASAIMPAAVPLPPTLRSAG